VAAIQMQLIATRNNIVMIFFDISMPPLQTLRMQPPANLMDFIVSVISFPVSQTPHHELPWKLFYLHCSTPPYGFPVLS